MDISEQISQLEEKIKKTPYHKGTEHQIGRWRARIAKLKYQMWGRQTRKVGSGKGYAVKKAGDATVVLVGPPSVGKSSLINKLSFTKSKVGSYDFTTLSVIPGVMKYNGAMIQIFDIPGVIKGAAQGKGRGKEVLSVVRTADLILIMVDVETKTIKQIKKELYDFGIRLDEDLPKVIVKKTSRGGIEIKAATPLSFVSKLTIKELAEEFGVNNAEIVIKEDITLERLIDAFMENRIYLPYLVVVNKVDLLKGKKFPKISEKTPLFISVQGGVGLEGLKKAIWQELGLIRVFLKPKNKAVDLNKPLIVKKGITLGKILEQTAIPNKEEVKRVKIYGFGAKFDGQEVGFDFQPQEGAMISFSR